MAAASSSTNGQPVARPAVGRSGSVSSSGHGVPEAGTAALLLTALPGLRIRLAPQEPSVPVGHGFPDRPVAGGAPRNRPMTGQVPRGVAMTT
jgi:hypothetical protein